MLGATPREESGWLTVLVLRTRNDAPVTPHHSSWIGSSWNRLGYLYCDGDGVGVRNKGDAAVDFVISIFAFLMYAALGVMGKLEP